MKEVDFLERRDGEWVCVEQSVLTRAEMREQARNFIDAAKPENDSVLADGRRMVRSWEF